MGKKKNIFIIAFASVFSTLNLSLAASTGTITFNGQLTANTCDVVVDNQGADATIILPTIETSLLNSATKTAGETAFVMVLRDCSGVLQTASSFFEAGAAVDPVTGRLNNMSGTATNVSLQLLDGSSPSREVIQVGNQNQVHNTTYVDVSSGSANLPYIVRYYAEAPTTPGTVVSNVVYSIQYQ